MIYPSSDTGSQALDNTPQHALALEYVRVPEPRVRSILDRTERLRRELRFCFSDEQWSRDLHMQMLAERSADGRSVPIQHVVQLPAVVAVFEDAQLQWAVDPHITAFTHRARAVVLALLHSSLIETEPAGAAVTDANLASVVLRRKTLSARVCHTTERLLSTTRADVVHTLAQMAVAPAGAAAGAAAAAAAGSSGSAFPSLVGGSAHAALGEPWYPIAQLAALAPLSDLCFASAATIAAALITSPALEVSAQGTHVRLRRQ
jgi:hypothetical protein